jgi:hypothetical protein
VARPQRNGGTHRIGRAARGVPATAALAVRDLGAAFAVGAPARTTADSERDHERFTTWLADRATGARRSAD